MTQPHAIAAVERAMGIEPTSVAWEATEFIFHINGLNGFNAPQTVA
ncbi:hypothetical protein [Xanthomonas sp. WHRI 6106]